MCVANADAGLAMVKCAVRQGNAMQEEHDAAHRAHDRG